MKKALIYLFPILFCASCNNSNKCVDDFYNYKKERNFKGMVSTLHSGFLIKTPKDDCIAFFKQQDSMNGKLIKYEIVNTEFKIKNITKTYIITVKCYYEKDSYTDILKLMKDGKTYKIYKYEYEY